MNTGRETLGDGRAAGKGVDNKLTREPEIRGQIAVLHENLNQLHGVIGAHRERIESVMSQPHPRSDSKDGAQSVQTDIGKLLCEANMRVREAIDSIKELTARVEV